MTDEKWLKTWTLFEALRGLSNRERDVLLADPTLDPEIVSELRALVEASHSTSLSHRAAASSNHQDGPAYHPGSELGRYVILGFIGRGGWGEIYLARDKELGRTVALKCLSNRGAHEAETLMAEARAASALNHPNIVTVYEVIRAGGHVAIAMEFVDGSPLRMLCRAPLRLENVIRYGSQVGQALSATHAVGIVHGDIKPENIIVRPDGYLKVLDFGLARRLEEDAGGRGGTLRYMAPEIIIGKPSSEAGDVFSFGLVLYEMATGRHPFPGHSELEVADAILDCEPEPPLKLAPQLGRELNALILSMLAKDPGRRPTALEVVDSLRRAAARGEELSRKRMRLAMWSGAALLVALLAATIPFWHSRTSTLRLHQRPLTGVSGFESMPSLSPDGRFVIYKWQPKKGDRNRVMVVEDGSDKPTELPVDGDKAGAFTWRPDGKSITYMLRSGEHAFLYSMDPDGSNQRRMTELKSAEGDTIEWSPDGKTIAFSDASATRRPLSIFIYSPATGERKQVSWPPDGSDGDFDVSFSPDGKSIAFRRNFAPANGDVFVANLRNPQSARRVTFGQKRGESLTWTRDGKGLVLTTEMDATLSLWFQSLLPGGSSNRLTEMGHPARSLRGALRRNRLAWVDAADDTNIWQIPMHGGSAATLIRSPYRDQDVACAGTGLLAFRSDRSGFPEIWISDRNGNSQTRVTNLQAFTGSPRWSPDGRHLAFDSRRSVKADIFVADCEPEKMKCGPARQLTDDAARAVLPNWSNDGSWIYFASQRSRDWQVWKVPAKGGQALPVTAKGGYFACESADGKWLYYSRLGAKEIQGIWRKAISPARFNAADTGEKILPLDYLATATWALWGDEIIFETFPFAGPTGVKAFNLTTRKTRDVMISAENALGRGLAVSPDGDAVLYTQFDRVDSNVIVADYEYVR